VKIHGLGRNPDRKKHKSAYQLLRRKGRKNVPPKVVLQKKKEKNTKKEETIKEVKTPGRSLGERFANTPK